MRTKTLNQDGETVQEIVQTAFVPRRPADKSDKG